MCAGAIVLARVKSVVFGASEPRAGAGGSAYNILEDGRLGHRVEVIAGVMDEECGRLLRGFFDEFKIDRGEVSEWLKETVSKYVPFCLSAIIEHHITSSCAALCRFE